MKSSAFINWGLPFLRKDNCAPKIADMGHRSEVCYLIWNTVENKKRKDSPATAVHSRNGSIWHPHMFPIHLPGHGVPRGTCAGSPFPLHQAMSQFPAHQLCRGSRILWVLLLSVLWVIFSLTDVSSLSPEETALINTYMRCHISWSSMQNTFSTLQIVSHRQSEHLYLKRKARFME